MSIIGGAALIIVRTCVLVGAGIHAASPVRHLTKCASVCAHTTSSRAAIRASRSHSFATTTMRSSIAATRGTTPATGRRVPSRPSSAMNAYRSAISLGNMSCTISNPMAIATSSPAPPLRSCILVARFTVMRRFGHGKSHDSNAARTRSRDSRHASSGWPTMVKPGSPMPT